MTHYVNRRVFVIGDCQLRRSTLFNPAQKAPYYQKQTLRKKPPPPPPLPHQLAKKTLAQVSVVCGCPALSLFLFPNTPRSPLPQNSKNV